MRAHAIVAAAALAFCLLLSAMAPSIDKGIDCGKLWQAAHERAAKASEEANK